MRRGGGMTDVAINAVMRDREEGGAGGGGGESLSD